MVVCWFCEIEKFPIYSMNGTEKLGGLCIYGMWVLQYRKDRWGGWLEFRCQIDWMVAGDLVEIRVKI